MAAHPVFWRLERARVINYTSIWPTSIEYRQSWEPVPFTNSPVVEVERRSYCIVSVDRCVTSEWPQLRAVKINQGRLLSQRNCSSHPLEGRPSCCRRHDPVWGVNLLENSLMSCWCVRGKTGQYAGNPANKGSAVQNSELANASYTYGHNYHQYLLFPARLRWPLLLEI